MKNGWSNKIDAFELWCWRRLLRVPWTAGRSNQSILKEIGPEYSLEGLMLKLKLHYFGHQSFEKTLMLRKIEGRRRRGWQRMRWLDGITNLMDMGLMLVTWSQSCPTLCNPMNRSTPGPLVHQQLLESTQTHVHWVADAIQLSHPLSFPSPPAFNQHQDLFQWLSSLHQVAKVLEFQLQHQSFQWTPRTDIL